MSANSARPSSWRTLLGRVGGLLFEPKVVPPKPAEDPAAIFDAALGEKHEHYETLKQAAASLLYLRNKLEGDLRERRADIARLHDELRNAVRAQDEPLALELITQKHELHDELASIERELEEVRTEAREAKDELTKRHAELRAMEREKLRITTTMKSARARAGVEAALGRASPDGRVSLGEALDTLREQAARVAMERSLD
ncbi:PspA/IM30 family protein, partial [Myxococcota bacterium]|nr:PspA/IM30 family protein [Myxococcota bacterium]